MTSNLAKDLSDYRREYTQMGLSRADLAADPLQQFAIWFAQAEQAQVLDPTAMVLTTVSAQHQPSARIVLLKQWDEQGFVFFSHYQSQKGLEIAQNPAVTVLFPWLALERQIEIRGVAEKLDKEASTAYFQSRPRESQLSAWASAQSHAIENRASLAARVEHYREEFAAQATIPCPEHWGGYRVIPDRMEFWQGRIGRLHDRFEYQRQTDQMWSIQRLAP
ncbi:MAG: pyridoxamine 5'-phosphate oxidase [bacterium]